jgi:ribosomal protein S13
MNIKHSTIEKLRNQVDNLIETGNFKSALDIASRYPLGIGSSKSYVICKSRLINEYKVSEIDLNKLNVIERKNPHYSSAANMKLYLEAEVECLIERRKNNI